MRLSRSTRTSLGCQPVSPQNYVVLLPFPKDEMHLYFVCTQAVDDFNRVLIRPGVSDKSTFRAFQRALKTLQFLVTKRSTLSVEQSRRNRRGLRQEVPREHVGAGLRPHRIISRAWPLELGWAMVQVQTLVLALAWVLELDWARACRQSTRSRRPGS